MPVAVAAVMTPFVGNTIAKLPYVTLNGARRELLLDALTELRARVRGDVILAGEVGYDDARQLWNGSIDRRPAVVVRCRASSDVRATVEFAGAHEMLLSVRGGGHHIAGNAIADGGLAIDLSAMRSVRVDPERKRARIDGGALLGDIDHETQSFGLALPLGINSTTGFGGLCVGGGFGWLTRKYGMTIDSLVSADVVTADGSLRIVSATNDAELFWAIRGGGGNYGIVTSFEVQLHAVGPVVHAGLVVYPGSSARDVLRGWRDFSETASDDISAWVILRKAPSLSFLPPEVHGTNIVLVAALYTGDPADGPRFTAPLTKLGTPIATVLGPQRYEMFQRTFDPLLTPGARNYWKSSDFEVLDDEALDVIVNAAKGLPGPECELFVAMLGGAASRIPSDATAYPGRDANYVMNIHGRWRSEEHDHVVRGWARHVFLRMAPFATNGGYVNFLTDDESSRIVTAYGANYARLQELKDRFDPANLFRMNHNILPYATRPMRRRAPTMGPPASSRS